MPAAPYLYFDGTCAEALNFYAGIFGDPDPAIMRYAEAPDAPPDWQSDRVIYGHVRVAGSLVMASDTPPGTPPAPPQASVSVCATLDSAEAARAAFDALCAGGEISMPFAATFFSPAFGMVKDRFGTQWMVMVETPPPG